MKNTDFRTVALAVPLLLLGVAPAVADRLNSIVLRVNDEIATQFDYEERRDARLAAISEARDLSPDDRHRLAAEAPRATMREILDELLLLSRARQLVIEPGPSEIDEAIDSTRQRMGIPTEEAFENALKSSNMTLADYRERTARSLKANQVIGREVNPLVKVEDEWLQRYYREHADQFSVPAKARLRELVVPSDVIGSEAALALATSLRAAIAGGEAMDAAAERQRGAVAESVVGPVDLGWVQPGELAKPLDSAVWTLPPGSLSEPIDARGGLHLVEVQERVESALRPYAEVKNEIEAQEKETRRDAALRKYLGDLEKQAFLVEQIPPEAAGFRESKTNENDPLAAFAPHRAPAAGAPPAMQRTGAEDSATPPAVPAAKPPEVPAAKPPAA